jgi:hypothetical protein
MGAVRHVRTVPVVFLCALVLELAEENKLSPKEADTAALVLEAARQQTACDIVRNYLRA